MGTNGVLGTWPKAAVQAIALNRMAKEHRAQWWIMVFANDMNGNLALHISKKGVIHVTPCACYCSPSQCDMFRRPPMTLQSCIAQKASMRIL